MPSDDTSVETKQAKVTVFYAWQNDSPPETNRYAILDALNVASSEIRIKYGIEMETDEATRGAVGSVNIPATILKKIKDADIFVCDITTIHGIDVNGALRTPNPNVTFELGYAVAYLGWDRIVMLFNQSFGTLEDAPFDFDRQRISRYKFDLDPQHKKQNGAALKTLCLTALEAIHQKNPPKQYDLRNLSSTQIQRQRDLDNLRWALSWIHWPTVVEHLQNAPKYVKDAVVYYWEEFDDVMQSPLFHIYDKTLDTLLRDLHSSWRKTHSYHQHYDGRSDGRVYIFTLVGDVFREPEEERDWKEIEEALKRMGTVIPQLLDHIRTHYLEIDLEDTSGKALMAYAKHWKAIEESVQTFDLERRGKK